MIDPARIAEAFVGLAHELSHSSPDQLPAVVSTACQRLGGFDAQIYLADLGQVQLAPLDRTSDERLSIDGTVAGRVYREETAFLASDDGAGRRRMWVPIIDSAERIGVLGVDIPTDADEVDERVWGALGSAIGEAIMAKSAYGDLITKVRRVDHASLAAEMRWEMLPPLTFTSPAVSVSGLFEPAYDIAGDTFDYAINGDTVQIAVLDAMGHGIEASRMANLAVSTYRHSRRRDRPLEAMLVDIDAAVADQFGDQRYVTGQIAELDTATGILSIINAGHPQPLVFRGGRFIDAIDCTPHLPMGLGSVVTTTTEEQLERGDVVVFFTDGVTDARSPDGLDFGHDRLVDLVGRAISSAVRPAEVLRQVIGALYTYGGPRLEDDASLVLLQWIGARTTDPA